MNNPTHLPEPAPKQAFQHFTGFTREGDEIEMYTEEEANTSYVSVQHHSLGYLQFNFGPTEPEDAKKLFLALCEVRSITQEN